MKPSIFDSQTWPSRLAAHVAWHLDEPRIHGYSLETDLAALGSPAFLSYLCIAGAPPASREHLELFKIATVFASYTTVAEAPAHAGSLTQLCGGSTAAVIGVCAMGLAEQAQAFVETAADLLAWLDRGSGEAPSQYLSEAEADRDCRARFRSRTAHLPMAEIFSGASLGGKALTLAAFHHCGLKQREQIVQALVFARMPVAVAEALSVRPRQFSDYAVHVPPMEYEEGK